MTEFFIKPYSFANFVDKDWTKWKDRKMVESYRYLRRKIDEMAAFAGNQTKIPVLFDEDDYKFLSQFPPTLWQQALVWRYNEGLLEASKLREQDPSHSIDAVPNDREQLVFKQGQKRYIFNNVYTGFRKLFRRLEHPIKNHSEHMPPGSDPANFSGPGLRDINPLGVDDAGQPLSADHPRHPSNYKQGLMDYDLSNPVIQSDEAIDAMPKEKLAKILQDQGIQPTEEKMEALKAKMKKNKQHSFAGMSVMQPGVSASRLLNTWIMAQGLGLLGGPEEVKDPHTGEPVPVKKESPQSVNPSWADSVGQSEQIPLRLPVISRRIKMRVENKNGETQLDQTNQEKQELAEKLQTISSKLQELQTSMAAKRMSGKKDSAKDIKDSQVWSNAIAKLNEKISALDATMASLKAKEEQGTEVAMPVLNPGVALPRISDLSNEQRQKFAVRAKKQSTDSADGDESGDDEKQEGGIGSLYNLLRNWDILTDTQREHMIKNQRNLLHLAAAERGDLSAKHGDQVDKWSQQGQYYVAGGFTPNKGVRKIIALPQGDDARRKIAEKYYQQLLWGQTKFPDSKISVGTVENIDYFFKWASRAAERGDAKMSKEALEMLRDLNADLGLSEVCAALLTLNLNNPELGVYDPELGLDGVSPQISQEELDHGRYNYAFNFCRDISQIATDTVASRRARKKGISAKTVSLQTGTKGKEGAAGELGDTLADKGAASSYGDVTGAKHSTRRHNLNPLTSADEAPDGSTAHPIARLTWKIPEVKHEISKFFQTKRSLIASQMPSLAGVVDKTLNDIDVAQEDMQDRRASLSPKLRSEQDEYMDEFFRTMIEGGALPLPQYDPDTDDFSGLAFNGKEFSLADMSSGGGKPLDAKGVITFIKSYWSEEGAKKYAVPLLMAIRNHFGKPIDQKQAQEEVANALSGKPNAQQPSEEPVKQPENIPIKPDSVPMKQPGGVQPAVAATDLSGIISSLPNNPSIWETIATRKSELAQHKQELIAALMQLREKNAQKRLAKQPLSHDEYAAQHSMAALVSTL